MAGLLGAPGYSDYIEMQEKKTKEEAEKERKAQDAAALHELRDVVAQWNRKHSKPAIKSENIMAGVRSWQRRVAGAEDGIYLPDRHSDARADGGFAFGH